jgi:DNA-directed RNA polymerase specialized sigma24 family protein
MDRTEALDALPKPYGKALRLRDAGLPASTIGKETGVPADAVPTLLEVGERKLAALLGPGGSEPGV